MRELKEIEQEQEVTHEKELMKLKEKTFFPLVRHNLQNSFLL
jgi:hypothetical protein